MLSKFLTFVLIVTIFGCEKKEYKKSQNSNVALVEELNHSDSEAVISKLESKSDLTPRETYYLASALSQKGGIDVFTLYSVLELELFRKKALEWHELGKEKNPYLSFMKSHETKDDKKRFEKRQKRWEKEQKKVIRKYGLSLDPEPTFDDDRDYLHDDENLYHEYMGIFKKHFDTVMKMPPVIKSRREEFDELIIKEGIFNSNLRLYSYHIDKIIFETVKENFLYPDKKPLGGDLTSGSWSIVYMNILWNTYESIPIMKKLPDLTETQQETIDKALLKYREILKDVKFKDISLKNILTLSGVSVMGIYKTSFDLDAGSMEDLLCTFEPTVILDHYDLIRRRLVFMSEIMNEVGGQKGLERYNSKINEIKNNLPEHLSQEERDHFISDVEAIKMKNCFNG